MNDIANLVFVQKNVGSLLLLFPFYYGYFSISTNQVFNCRYYREENIEPKKIYHVIHPIPNIKAYFYTQTFVYCLAIEEN